MNCLTWYELVNNLIGTTIASLAMYFVCSPRAGAGLGEVKLILQQHAPRMISPPWRRFWRFIDIVSETGKKGGGTRKRRCREDVDRCSHKLVDKTGCTANPARRAFQC